MQPQEIFWLIEAKKPRKTYGSLSEADMAELYDDLKGKGLIKDG